MPEALMQDPVATPGVETVAPQSELPLDGGAEQPNPDATDAPENVAESDEQKNERVQQEAKAKAEKRARGVQKRMDELTADKYAERRRADQLAVQNAEILAMLRGKQAPQGGASEGEPKRESFTDDVAFLDARARYYVQSESAKAAEIAKRTAEETFARSTAAQREAEQQRSFIERQRAVEKTIPDYATTMEDSDVELPQNVLNMIRLMPDGPSVAYHFAKNPQLAQQFATNDPAMHGFILGQISATVKAPPPVSKAPAPGKPVASRPGSSTEPPSDPEQYFAWAQKNMR